MSDEAWPWSVLGFKRMPKEATEIRRAYARTLKKMIRDSIRSASLRRSSQLQALLAALWFVVAGADLWKDMNLGYASIGMAAPLLIAACIADGETTGYRLEIALRRALAWASRLFQRSANGAFATTSLGLRPQ